MAIEFDDVEMRSFAADLTSAGSRIAGQVTPVVHRGANKIKRQMRADMAESTHFKGVARAISYDLIKSGGPSGGVIEAEIGPATGKPGSLANIAYFGTSRGGGTVPDPVGALEAEVPHFLKALGDVLGEAL